MYPIIKSRSQHVHRSGVGLDSMLQVKDVTHHTGSWTTLNYRWFTPSIYQFADTQGVQKRRAGARS